MQRCGEDAATDRCSVVGLSTSYRTRAGYHIFTLKLVEPGVRKDAMHSQSQCLAYVHPHDGRGGLGSTQVLWP